MGVGRRRRDRAVGDTRVRGGREEPTACEHLLPPKRSQGIAASRGSSSLNRWGHVCATPLPRHWWPAGYGARSGRTR
ncbi:unnamed protein product [Spirodela intermedia]|uniref:Uncharacterized protein n=1 Tax=Spirodela intermedia TaxID=51605 RepID=A0A7I8LA33_SPIIN|nr:unnamed protein product [Spirodela intermedia]